MGNIAVAIIFALFGVFCCPLISVILGGVELATFKTPDGKRNSTIVLVAGLAGIVLNVVLFATVALDNVIKQRQNP
ncbi:MAG: hypothetical protein K2X82_22415 [Gemmataceae bacterium]|nr:hypothetical protein [Gemmataceae bacterium]